MKNDEHIKVNTQNCTDINLEDKNTSNDYIEKSLTKYKELKEECFKFPFILGHFYIFANIGLVSSGKSTVCNILEKVIKSKYGENLVNFSTVSSDEIRMGIEKTTSNQKIITKKTKTEFDSKIKAAVLNLDKNKFNFLIADKNFFVNTIFSFKT